MSKTHSRRTSVLLGKDLQQETGHCAFCDQPSSQLNWFSVSCIEESSLSYRWTRWITKDPKKLRACFALSNSIAVAIFCWAIFVTDDQSRLIFLLLGLVFISLFDLRPLSGWTEMAVPLPHCGGHRGILKTDNELPEQKSRTGWLLENKYLHALIFGSFVTYLVLILIYGLFVANEGKVVVTYFLVPFFLLGLLVGLITTAVRLLIDVRRFSLSPYGITSSGEVREIWHLDDDYCQRAKELPIAREVITESCQVIDVHIDPNDRD